jgi:hypothetical protein
VTGTRMRFVDRLEDELIRAGYTRPRHRRAPAVAGVVALACAGAILAFALRTNAAPAPAKPGHQCPSVARTDDAVDPRLLKALGVLKTDPSRPVQSRCAEAAVRVGPVYAGGTRYVGPGLLGGNVFMVPVLHWSGLEGVTGPKARAWRQLPGACLVTVGGPQYDAASLCVSVREIPLAGAFVASGVPTEGPLADDLRRRGIKARGTFMRLIVPDGVAAVEMRFKGGAKKRVRVTGNAAIANVTVTPEAATDVRFVFYDADGDRVTPRR